ncbi:MAG TPA: ferritin-like domain-containing protein, partial [Polyangiaceae bacterium]|nr:ferritin-like domain-containing protein [Polyangiaceae bacterium]
TGRRTDGVHDPAPCDRGKVGDVFAGRAYLEEVSVHAFARLERELAAHGAPAALRSEARRARRDEIRHTAMMARLARRFGATPRSPEPPGPTPVRSLRAMAVENAVEGCVRETYGAVVGLMEARASSDAGVRRAMASIAADECRHAELSWAAAAWLMPRLTEEDRAEVTRAARRAVEELAGVGDPRVVAMLDEQVWRRAA